MSGEGYALSSASRWGFSFVAYAYDIVLLASALRCMRNICNNFATEHGLTFNPNKTQLICFRRFKLNYQPSCNSFPECNTEIHGCSETSWCTTNWMMVLILCVQ